VGFIQYLYSIDYLKESNVTTTETPYARFFNQSGASGPRKYSPYEVADGEEEENDEGEHDSKTKPHSSENNAKPASPSKLPPPNATTKMNDVCDLDLNDWIRISAGKSKAQQPSTPTHSNPRAETISSSCSASDHKLPEDEWVLL
jgi:hypothetical protein